MGEVLSFSGNHNSTEVQMEFQTRSEETGLAFFSSLKEAFDHAKADTSVWKIGFHLPNGEPVRLVRRTRVEYRATENYNVASERVEVEDWVYEDLMSVVKNELQSRE